MYHIGMTQWIVGDELLEVSCKRLQQCGYDGIEFAADPYGLNAEECQIMMKKYGKTLRIQVRLNDSILLNSVSP